MRFKKLRIFVIISLILFVLIVGDIIAFGLIQKNDNSGFNNLNTLGPIDNKTYSNKNAQLPPGAQLIIVTPSQPIIQPTPQPTIQQPPTQPPTVVHPPVVTGAS
jgi:hypothetical protein